MCNISNSGVELRLIFHVPGLILSPCQAVIMLAHPFLVFSVQEQSAHREWEHRQSTAAKSSQGHNVITWTKQNQKGLQPSSPAAAHDKPQYQFSKRQDLNLSCSAAQQTLLLTSLWQMPQRCKFRCNVLSTPSHPSCVIKCWNDAEETLAFPPAPSHQPWCARNTCTLLPSCDCSDTSTSCGKGNAQNSVTAHYFFLQENAGLEERDRQTAAGNVNGYLSISKSTQN